MFNNILPFLNDTETKDAKKPRVLMHNESLVGAGHIATMHRLGSALEALGFEILHVTGSRLAKAPQLDFGTMQVVDLPEAKGNFYSGQVKTSNHIPIQNDEAWQKEYKDQLLTAYNDFSPDIVITEFWPVRRGCYDFAMIPLMEAIQNNEKETNLFCLLRDYVHMSVTNYGAHGSDEGALEALEKYYFNEKSPSIIVRGAEDILPLEESFPFTKTHNKHIKYAGYFVEDTPEKSDIGANEVLVTCGGGYMDYCFQTSKSAILAREDTVLGDKNWRILLPHDTPEDKFIELKELAQDKAPNGGIIVEHNRSDFAQRLQNAELLITHAGNTIPEAVNARTKAVIMPRIKSLTDTFSDASFDKPKEEQLARSEAFASAKLVGIAMPNDVKNTMAFAEIINNTYETQPRSVTKQNGQHLAAETIRDIFLEDKNPVLTQLLTMNEKNENKHFDEMPLYTSYEN